MLTVDNWKWNLKVFLLVVKKSYKIPTHQNYKTFEEILIDGYLNQWRNVLVSVNQKNKHWNIVDSL